MSLIFEEKFPGVHFLTEYVFQSPVKLLPTNMDAPQSLQ